MEPEEFNFHNDSITSPGYALRPENMEAAFTCTVQQKMNSTYAWLKE